MPRSARSSSHRSGLRDSKGLRVRHGHGGFWSNPCQFAPRPRDYQMLIMPFTFFWRMLLAKKRHQGLVAKAS